MIFMCQIGCFKHQTFERSRLWTGAIRECFVEEKGLLHEPYTSDKTSIGGKEQEGRDNLGRGIENKQ